MSDNQYPSVQVSERLFLPTSASATTTSTSGAFIGKSNQGPTVPTLVTSWSNFTTLFGTTYTDLHYAVSDFFANGGRQAFVTRIAGVSAVAADLDYFDTEATNTSGTPLFTATATNPGKWGNQLRLVATVRDATNYRFDVALYRVPVGATFDGTAKNSQYLVDQWIDVTLDPDSPRYFYSVANAPSATGSQLVTFSGQSYDPATPLVRPLPGQQSGGGYAFTGGVDGSYSGAYEEGTAYATALTSLQSVNGPLILNLPGVTTAATVKAAVTEAARRGDTFVVCDTAAGLAPAAAATYVNTDLNLGTISQSGPSFAAVYYPHVHMPAIGSAAPGRTTLRAPGGAVAGLMQAFDTRTGPWKAPAGLQAQLSGAIAVERQLTSAELTSLNGNHINAIRSIVGSGVVVMGARTVKKSGLDRYVNVRRTVLEITEALKTATQFAVFENNDERLWGRVSAICSSYLGSVWQAGGLRGAQPGEAFYVKCDETNNTPGSVEQGTVNVEVGIAPLSPAEFVVINIGQFDGGTSAAVSI
jgi:hypothetical protein